MIVVLYHAIWACRKYFSRHTVCLHHAVLHCLVGILMSGVDASTSSQVWYNEASSSYQVCDGSGEDPNCSDSLLLPDSISDHLTYLGIPISGLC